MNAITRNDIGKPVKLPDWEGREALRVLKVLNAKEYELLFQAQDVHAVGCGTGAINDEYFLGVDAEWKLHVYGCDDSWIRVAD